MSIKKTTNIVNFGNEPYYCKLELYTNVGGKIPIGAELIASVEFTAELKNPTKMIRIVLKNSESLSSSVLLLNGGEKFYIELRPPNESIANVAKTPNEQVQHWELKGTYCIERSSIQDLKGQGYKDDAPIVIMGVDEETKNAYQSGTLLTYIPAGRQVSSWLKEKLERYGFQISNRWKNCDTRFDYPYQLVGTMYDLISEVVELMWCGNEHSMIIWRSRDGKINLDTVQSLTTNPPLNQPIIPLLYQNENGSGGSFAKSAPRDSTKSFMIHKSTIEHMKLESTVNGLNGYTVAGFNPYTKNLGSASEGFRQTIERGGGRLKGARTMITDSHYSKNNTVSISAFKPTEQLKDIAHDVFRIQQEAFIEDMFTTTLYTKGVNTAVHCGSLLGITLETIGLIDTDLDPINSYHALASSVVHTFGGFGAVTEVKLNRNTIMESRYAAGRIQ